MTDKEIEELRLRVEMMRLRLLSEHPTTREYREVADLADGITLFIANRITEAQ